MERDYILPTASATTGQSTSTQASNPLSANTTTDPVSPRREIRPAAEVFETDGILKEFEIDLFFYLEDFSE
jgi:hypothetical protein